MILRAVRAICCKTCRIDHEKSNYFGGGIRADQAEHPEEALRPKMIAIVVHGLCRRLSQSREKNKRLLEYTAGPKSKTMEYCSPALEAVSAMSEIRVGVCFRLKASLLVSQRGLAQMLTEPARPCVRTGIASYVPGNVR